MKNIIKKGSSKPVGWRNMKNIIRKEVQNL